MTARGKLVLTVLLLAVVGFGVYRWWDKLAPVGRPVTPSVNPQEVKKAVDHWKAKGLDFSQILYQPEVPTEVVAEAKTEAAAQD